MSLYYKWAKEAVCLHVDTSGRNASNIFVHELSVNKRMSMEHDWCVKLLFIVCHKSHSVRLIKQKWQMNKRPGITSNV